MLFRSKFLIFIGQFSRGMIFGSESSLIDKNQEFTSYQFRVLESSLILRNEGLTVKKWSVHAKITGSRYLGEVEAKTKEEAEEKAEKLADENSVSLCHQCSDQIEDPEIESCYVEEVTHEK